MASADKDTPKTPPPYVAWKTLKNFLRSLSQGVPPQIDKSMMRSLSGGVQTQIIQALKAMHLIDEKGAPSPKLHQLVRAEGDEFKKALRDILIATYPFMRSSSFSIKTATMKMLEQEMGKLAGGSTVNKCIAFFVPAVKDAGIELSPYIEKPGKRSSSNGKQRKARTSSSKGEMPTPPPPPPVGLTGSFDPLILGLLNRLPKSGADWSMEDRANWGRALFVNFELVYKGGGSKKVKITLE